MKKENFLLGAGAALVLAIIAYLILENRKREDELSESLERERQVSKQNTAMTNVVKNLKFEINEIIEKKDDLSSEVKKQLKSLVEEYQDIDEKVTNELLTVSTLIEMREESKAIMVMAKIIENLLKRIYSNDIELPAKPSFFDLIKFAKQQDLIEKDEFHFINGLREIRNDEAHNLSIKKNNNIAASSMLIGVSIIFKFAKIVRNL